MRAAPRAAALRVAIRAAVALLRPLPPLLRPLLLPAALLLLPAALFLLLPAGCGGAGDASEARRPNILWIVWDTVRADRLSLYGHTRPTTPFLDEWARGARVFDDCISTAGTTVPAHASWFTGVQPAEHLRDNNANHLNDGFTTAAELLQASGYRTFMFSANPHVGRSTNFSQGFDRTEHPWDEQHTRRALEIRKIKLAPMQSASAGGRPAAALSKYDIKDAGTIARDAAIGWLNESGGGGAGDKPFFIFLNYMEAHMPYLPGPEARAGLMTPGEIERSYAAPPKLQDFWAFTFRQAALSESELQTIGLIYDAAIAELDALLGDLVAALDARGMLKDTVVIVTSDHGEHLGEQHMLEHQYSIYEPLARVPLIVHYPAAFTPGRDARPVMNADLFATVLGLAGLPVPEAARQSYPGLREPPEQRIRVAACPAYPTHPFEATQRRYPDFDSEPWRRTLRAVYDGPWKLIWSSDGRHELYDLREHAVEARDLFAVDKKTAAALLDLHDRWLQSLRVYDPGGAPARQAATDEERRRLEAIGY